MLLRKTIELVFKELLIIRTEIIIEYIYFSLRFIKKINIKNIRESEYIQDLDKILQNNIDTLIRRKIMDSFILDNNYLKIIYHNTLEIYKNKSLIGLKYIDL